MQPNHYGLMSHINDTSATAGIIHHDDSHNHSRSQSLPMRPDDSWIEISSQPSTSSLSSTSTGDEIITTGLRVQGSRPSELHRPSRRRRLERLAAVTTAQAGYSSSREPSVAGSSQDEYEESESESDRVLTSSNEDVKHKHQHQHPTTATTAGKGPRFIRAGASPVLVDNSSDDEEDDDDDATALGMRNQPAPFVPQPNAFSHPPASRDPSWTSPTEPRRYAQPSVASNSSRVTAVRAISDARRQQQQQQHTPYNMISPSHHADQDAALRASLSTLLSCAAAARGRQKQESQPAPRGASGAETSSFRLVPESVAMGESSEEEGGGPSSSVPAPAAAPGPATTATAISPQPLGRQPKSTMARPASPTSKTGRRSSSSKDRVSSSPYHTSNKKSRRTTLTEQASTSTGSPTLMTWFISAGVVVIFSAISFSAGYMLGREVGQQTEMTMGDSGMGGYYSGSGEYSRECGREAVKGGLKRLRLGGAGAGSRIMA